jgi:hypothetical protein
MSDPTNPLDWVAYAEEDFLSAKTLLKRSRPPSYQCILLSQPEMCGKIPEGNTCGTID